MSQTVCFRCTKFFEGEREVPFCPSCAEEVSNQASYMGKSQMNARESQTTALRNKITELEAKLQDAKCCENCKYNDYRFDQCNRDDEECDEKYSGWELRKYRK
jgi:hypothetical protein